MPRRRIRHTTHLSSQRRRGTHPGVGLMLCHTKAMARAAIGSAMPGSAFEETSAGYPSSLRHPLPMIPNREEVRPDGGKERSTGSDAGRSQPIAAGDRRR